ncbi:hypothetical protein WN51_00604 [Melipona quadrifasciata]|uniref:Uncharacterized protein n=1 Tax=Melipona quadrifasciata TaxID=166423 RepID=A0A0M9A2L3_9HYME|nr:hypothetical protein WN51_00604 [Melipona quadrifasciata]
MQQILNIGSKSVLGLLSGSIFPTKYMREICSNEQLLLKIMVEIMRKLFWVLIFGTIFTVDCMCNAMLPKLSQDNDLKWTYGRYRAINVYSNPNVES